MTFTISQTEERAADMFFQEHDVRHKLDEGAKGSRRRFEFERGGIGDVVTVSCHRCGERRDVTDYGSW